MTERNVVWFVAAGTGGHIFPGLSIAKHLRDIDTDIQITFFGTEDRLEATLIPQNNEKVEFVRAGRWKGRGIVGKLKGLWGLFAGFLEFFIGSFKRKRADLLVSIGGYVALPIALVCWFRGIDVVLVEPNLRAGLANKLVSRWAKFAIANKGSDSREVLHCRVFETGTPIRRGFKEHIVQREVKTILVLGGSQGAKPLNDAMLAIACDCPALKDVQFIVQAGKAHFETLEDEVRKSGLDKKVQVLEFIDDMAKFLTQIDLVVSRAGASTVTELAAVGMPTIFVPYPYAADNHQMVNAQMIADAGGAKVVDQLGDNMAENLDSACSELVHGLEGFEKRSFMSRSMKKWSNPNVLEDFVRLLDGEDEV